MVAPKTCTIPHDYAGVVTTEQRYSNAAFDEADYSSFNVWTARDRYDVLAGLVSGAAAPEISRGRIPLGIAPRVSDISANEEVAYPPRTFFDRLYNRIHVIPDRIDAGNLVGRETYSLIIWNAYFEPQGLNALQELDTPGILYSFPDGEVIPFSMPALKQTPIEIELTMQGPPIIDGVYRFLFDSDTVDLPITGTRMITWSIRPDGGQTYGEKFQWLTDVIPAGTGKEQRISLRETPEQIIEATFTAIREDASVMDSLLWGWQSRLFAFPLWHLPVKLTASVVQGNTVLPVSSTVAKRFLADGLGMIYCGAKSYETFEISSVSTNSITLARPLREGWPAGAEVIPLRGARAETAIKQQWPVNKMSTAQIRFSIEDDPTFTPAELGPLYNGYYILPLRPNWLESMEESVERNFDHIDNPIGRRDYTFHSELATVTRSFLFFFKGLQNIDAFIKWHYARRGAQVPFWVPSWKNDLTLTDNIQIGDNFIKVVNNDYENLYLNRAGRDHLYICTKTKCEPYARKIVSIYTDQIDETKTVITLDSTFPAGHSVADIESISFMGLHRMASDEITIEWLSDEVANVNSNMKMLSDGA